MTTFKERLRNVAAGDCCAFPTGWMGSGGHAIFFIFEKEEGDTFALIVCNTGMGIGYHPQDISFYPKTKCRTCIRLEHIPEARLVEDGWLYVMLCIGACGMYSCNMRV